MPMKSAFSMIELIIAIVVMSIVAVTVPTIIIVTTKANETNLRQEAIMSARTRLASILKLNFAKTPTSNQPDCEKLQGMFPIVKMIPTNAGNSRDLEPENRIGLTFFESPRCVSKHNASGTNQEKSSIQGFKNHVDKEIIDGFNSNKDASSSKNILALKSFVKIMHSPDIGNNGGIPTGQNYKNNKEITYLFNGAGDVYNKNYYGSAANNFAVIVRIFDKDCNHEDNRPYETNECYKNHNIVTMRGFAFNIGDRPRLKYRVIN